MCVNVPAVGDGWTGVPIVGGGGTGVPVVGGGGTGVPIVGDGGTGVPIVGGDRGAGVPIVGVGGGILVLYPSCSLNYPPVLSPISPSLLVSSSIETIQPNQLECHLAPLIPSIQVTELPPGKGM